MFRHDRLYFWGAHGLLFIANASTWFFLNNSFGFVLTATIAAVAILHNDKMSRRRATIDLILSRNQDDDLKKSDETMSKLEEKKLRELAIKLKSSAYDGINDPDELELQQISSILEVLNWYEFVATGVREGAFDYKIFHRNRHTLTVRDWDKLEPFVNQLRLNEDKNTFFKEFAWLAYNFKKYPLKDD